MHPLDKDLNEHSPFQWLGLAVPKTIYFDDPKVKTNGDHQTPNAYTLRQVDRDSLLMVWHWQFQ